MTPEQPTAAHIDIFGNKAEKILSKCNQIIISEVLRLGKYFELDTSRVESIIIS